MTKLKELNLTLKNLRECISHQIDKERDRVNDISPEHDKFFSCVHVEDGMFTASVWKKDKGNDEKDYYSEVTYNDIVNGKKVTMEQDEFCKTVQIFLCKHNEIEGY